ncbi:MAG: SUF system NifU family Fe-S cluster assembly protein [Ruminococcus sp.]|nr:SUF system NifU family Fe-S cluster assembly protein [Ruminococcus sp.]
MANNSFYNMILTDHNLHPAHKHGLECANFCHEGINPSCGDDIVLNLDIRDGVIRDGSYTGSGCAVSQASADIMLDLVIGKTVEEAAKISQDFMAMIKGEADEETLEQLDEAAALQDIAHMPSRVKCAVLGWHTLEELIKQSEEQ